MVVAAAVQKYFPSRRDVRITKDVRAFTVLTSCASDLDVIGDFVFLSATLKNHDEVPLLVRHVQFFFCMLGLVIWTILASDGRVAKPFFKWLKIPFVSTGHLLLAAVFLEDIPQVVISFLVEYVYTSDEPGMSNWAVFNLMTAGYDMLIKLSEAYDERHDVLDTGAHLTAYRGHRAPVTSIALTEDGGGDGGTQRRLITGSYDNTAKVWEISTGRCLRTLRGHGDAVSSLATGIGIGNGVGTPDGSSSLATTEASSHSSRSRSSSPGGRRGGLGFLEAHANIVVTASHDKTLRAWDVDTGEVLATFVGHTNEVTSVARVDPTTFVSGSTDKTVKLWRYGHGPGPGATTCLRTYVGHACRVNCVANVGGKLFLSGSSDKTARLWTTESGSCLRTFAGHHRSVLSVAALDGRTFVTGSADDTVRLWDVESSDNLHPETGTVSSVCTFHGHECQVFSVSAGADPDTFLSAGGDGRVKMWDANTGECVKTFESHGVWVLAVKLVDSRTYVTASWDHTAKRWAVSAPGELVRKGFVPLEEPLVALSSTRVMKSVRSLRVSMTLPGKADADVNDVEKG